MQLENIISSGTRATREGFGAGLLELGRQNPNVVALTADLLESLLMQHFKKEFPERFFQVGIAEANISSGPVRAYSTRFASVMATFNTGWFMFELAMNPKGSRFVAPSYAGAFVLDLENGSFADVGRIGQYASHGPLSAVFSPDSTKLITANWSFNLPAERGVRILDAQTLQTLSVIDNYPFSWSGNSALGPGRLTLSRDGNWLAVTIANGVRLYDIGQELNGRSFAGCAHQPIDTRAPVAPAGPQLSPADFDSYGRPVRAAY